MLSTRGQSYASSGLMSGYERKMKEGYHKANYPNGETSFLLAENFLMKDEILSYINTKCSFNFSQLSYNEGPIGTKRLREATASHLNEYFDPFTPVTAEHVSWTAGVTGLNEMIALNLTDEGEGILLGRPSYGSFFGDLTTKSRCKLVYTAFDNVDQFSTDCIEKYEQALLGARKEGIKIRALLLCNPHNPLGKCYPVETLKKLFIFCHKYSIHLISDEIYALSVFEVERSKRTPFTSVLSIDPTGLLRTDQIHVQYGMSKDFGTAGLRLGCLISQNKEMTKATRAIGRFNWPSEVSCAIATTILEDKSFITAFIKKSRERLAQHYILTTKILDQAGINYVRDGNAGFFIWIDLSPFVSSTNADSIGWEAEKGLQRELSAAGVEMSSGFAYKSETPGWFRVIFTVDRDTLEEALRRIVDRINKRKTP